MTEPFEEEEQDAFLYFGNEVRRGIDLEIWLHFGAVTEHLGKVDVFVVRLNVLCFEILSLLKSLVLPIFWIYVIFDTLLIDLIQEDLT